VRSIVDAIVKSLNNNFDIMTEKEAECKYLNDNQIMIISRNYNVLLQKKKDEVSADDEVEVDASSKKEDVAKDTVTVDTILDKGKRMVIRGIVQTVEDKYIAIKCGSLGRIELYLPIKGFEKGDFVTLAIKRT